MRQEKRQEIEMTDGTNRDKTSKPFNYRAFVGSILAVTVIGLPITGIGLHASAPETSAHHAWSATHGLLGLYFVLFSAWHIKLNRRALSSQTKDKSSSPPLTREALAAGALVAIVLAFAGHAMMGH